MLNILKNTYETYLKKFPVLLLFILPLLAYSAVDDILKRFFADSDFVSVWNVLSIVFSALIYTAIQIYVYKYLMKLDFGKFVAFLKIWAKFFVVQLVLTNLIMLPVLGLMIVAVSAHVGRVAFPVVLLINTFAGFWVLARVNVILPMIAAGDEVSPKSVWDFGRAYGYAAWLLPVVGIYLPYVLSYYLIHCEWVKIIVTGILCVLPTVFNVVYYQTQKGADKKSVSAKKKK